MWALHALLAESPNAVMQRISQPGNYTQLRQAHESFSKSFASLHVHNSSETNRRVQWQSIFKKEI